MSKKLKSSRLVMAAFVIGYMIFSLRKCCSREEFNLYSEGAPEKERRWLKFKLNSLLYGLSAEDYFVFRFYERTFSQKINYLTEGGRLYLDARFNRKELWDQVMDKATFYETYRPFLGRAVLPVNSEADRPAFEDMCRQFGSLILKPRDTDCGRGIHKVSVTTPEEIETAWRDALDNHLLAEEIMKNHPVIAAFHPDSLNTFRVHVLVDGHGKGHILGASLRCGNNGKIVDNAAAGGVYAGVDEDTGVIFSDGYDLYGQHTPTHPFTGVPFKGTVIPNWDELKKKAVEAAETVPGLRVIGWDWVLLSDGTWALQEGNCPGGFVTVQCARDVGFLPKVLDILSH